VRIHRLRLEGIGPYATPQELDFDELSASGLFLLTGPTGAGKTTILDAIVYALYGTVPGVRGTGSRGDRATSERIVSDLRDVNAQPQVELEFTVAGRRFRLARVPQHLRPKARGEGLTIEKSSVALSELVDGEWVGRTSDPAEVGTTIKELLGMSAAQFSQVVLLPQGEFAGFLRADDKSRREVLERLFHVEQYKSAQAWFEERAKDARARLEEAQGDLRGVVDRLVGALGSAAGTPPEDRSLEAIERWMGELRMAADEVGELATLDAETATATRAAADAACRRTEQLLARISERDARSAALGTLEARLPKARAWIAEHESPELATDDARWADAARAAQEHLARLEERRGDAAQAAELDRSAAAAARDAEAAQRGALEAEAQITDLAPALVAAREEVSRTESAEQMLVALQGERDRLAARLAAMGRRDALLRDRAAAERAAADALERQRSAELAVAEATPPAELDAAITAAAERLTALERSITEQRGQREAIHAELQRTTDLLARAARLRAQLEAATAEHELRRARWHEAREQHLSAREARLDAMAAELAADLDEGAPCPVCGSTEHPAPASPAGGGDLRAAEHAAEERALAAQAAVDQAAIAVAQAQGELAALGELEALEHQQSEQRAELGALEAELATTASALTTEQGRLDERRAALVHARSLADSAQAAAQAAQEAQHRLQLLTAEFEAAEREAGAEPIDDGALAAADAALAEQRAHAAAAASARERVVTLERSLEAARTAASELRQRAAAAASASEAARAQAGAITVRLAELIAPHADLTQACEHAARRATTLEAAAGIVADCATARIELASAEQAVAEALAADAPTDDEPAAPTARLAHRTELLRAAERSREEAASTLREAHRHIAELQRAAEALADARDVLGPAAAEAERLQRLDATVRGLGDNRRRISLTTYVLAARLEEVAAAATLHLQRMSSGRFSLVHHDERFGNGPAGLGLRVLDAYSGEERDTATLSGGEAFYASLSLALGLADVVQGEAGGRPLETLLVDEGFGALDADTLEEVLGELDELRAAGRAIGLVSHVPALAERIPAQLRVSAGPSGSTARVVVGHDLAGAID
jgi:exonuclease SbcC